MYDNINIIFHYPLPLNKNAKSASGIRPMRMLDAFKKLGCNIDLVTGYAAERKDCIKKIKKNIKQGKHYDLVYSESSTMPTILTEKHHLPTHPMCDWLFLRYCKKNDIPIGLFYRDIYWLFEDYGRELNWIKAAIAKLAYKFDLWVYQKVLTKLYLPSIEMGAYIPRVSPLLFAALPPGHVVDEIKNEVIPDFLKEPLKLFYVGGMSKHYQMHKLFDAVKDMPGIELIVCTREEEWLAVKKEYPALTPNIQVLHLSGKDMEHKLQFADIALLFIEPFEYRNFASPVKLYEYLGFQKPVIASKGTLAGEFVEDNGIGWTIPYDVQEIKKLLKVLSSDISVHVDVRNKLQQISPQHSWQSRASQVIKDLVK